MIYTPQKHPKQALILITIIAFIGIIGAYSQSFFLTVFALLFWMQYTAVLSYYQFKKKRHYDPVTFTYVLLNPIIRFFLFEFLAVIGIWSIFMYNTGKVGAMSLFVWWLFAMNFYFFYTTKEKKRY